MDESYTKNKKKDIIVKIFKKKHTKNIYYSFVRHDKININDYKNYELFLIFY